ncbi:MAG: hypothetical protein AMS14_00600 [Planctomycetes bacterium DG_20]|nr:MAG: hypothetical protein AMS14_00600 [Planctomycetes bacterium DG_20]
MPRPRAALARTLPGTGKTHQVLNLLAETRERAVYVVPTHDLARQVQADLDALGVRTHYWREGPTEEDGCPDLDLVAFFRRFGFIIRFGPCARCRRRKSCPYRKVYTSRANRSADVLIMTSWHLRRRDLWALKATADRDLVVLDEDALGALTAPTELTVAGLQGFVENLGAVREPLDPRPEGEAGSEVFAWLTRRLRKPVEGDEAVLAVTDILRRAALDILRACATSGHGRWLPSERALVQDTSAYDRGLLENDELFDGLLRSAYAAARTKKALPNLFAALRGLLLAPRPVHLSAGACRWTHRANVPPDRHVLLLDASAEPEVVRAVLRRPVEAIDTPPVAQAATVFQVMDRVGTRNAARRDMADEESWLRRLAVEVARRHRVERLLCITFKEDERKLQDLLDRVHGDATVVHYGALRGFNAYGDYPAALILGRPMPNEAHLQLLAVSAFGLGALSDDLKAPRLEWRMLSRTIGPDLWTIRHQQYADLLWAAVWRHVVTGELMQAVGRLRPLTNAATIYVATNEPLPDALDVTAVYAGELFPAMALSGRRSDFAENVRRYAETMGALRAEGLKATNRGVCRHLGLKEPNGLRYRSLAKRLLEGQPGPAATPLSET